MPSCWLFGRVLSSGDDQHIAFRKRVIVILSLALVMSGALAVATYRVSIEGLVGIPVLVSALVLLVQLAIERRIRSVLVELLLYIFTCAVLVTDCYMAATMGTRSWIACAVLLDLVLVCDLPIRAAYIILVLTSVWLLTSASEDAVRWGLYDAFPVTRKEHIQRYDCSDPPCALGAMSSTSRLVPQLAAFILDFYFTREFAYKLERERKSMQNVILAAEWISHCLSRFDLAAAEQAIDTSSLPPRMHEAFNNILGNLHAYRAFLPQSCLTDVEENLGRDSRGSRGSRLSLQSPLSPSCASRASSVDIALEAALELKRISYTVTNLVGTHESVAVSPSAYVTSFADYVSVVVCSVRYHGGVVGVVVGDHVHASFNAVKKCAVHGQSCVQALINVSQMVKEMRHGLSLTSGAATGHAHCGPLGSRDLRSFSTLGRVAVLASGMERCCRLLNVPLLCSGAVYKEAGFAFVMKLVVADVTVRGGGSGVRGRELVYEVLTDNDESTKGSGSDEWMYDMGTKAWDTYNGAGRALLLGSRGEALRLLAIRGLDRPPEVINGERWLLDVAQGLLELPDIVV